MNPDVDHYIDRLTAWQDCIKHLRAIMHDCGLQETFKWRNPCYMHKKSNILILGSFKDYCAISFTKGALLHDTDGLLDVPGPHSRTVRISRFKDLKDILGSEAIIKRYVFEAIAIEDAGTKVAISDKSDIELPYELQSAFKQNSALKTAFNKLTPGRRRGYLIHFTGAKQSQTRTNRIDACTQRMLAGFGLNHCTCGLSNRMPSCDGSHKRLA